LSFFPPPPQAETTAMVLTNKRVPSKKRCITVRPFCESSKRAPTQARRSAVLSETQDYPSSWLGQATVFAHSRRQKPLAAGITCGCAYPWLAHTHRRTE
jgi:hypothetical protein